MYLLPECVRAKLCFILCLALNVLCFNLETRIPIIKQETVGSYFGYSVAEHMTDLINGTSWLLVGAPLGQNRQPNTNRSGALWKCPLTTGLNDCEQVVTDGKRLQSGGLYDNNINSDDLRPPQKDEIKNDQWLGVTVKSQGAGGKVVVCAHRYTKISGESREGQGLCYTLTNTLNYNSAWEPCKGRPKGKGHEEYGYCQAGTSSSYLDDGTIVLGSPGSYIWRGTLFVIDTNDNFLQRDKLVYYGPVTQELSPVDKYSYIGMSVAGGRFFGSYMSFASGAPRSNGTGQVVIFSKNMGISPIKNPINVSVVIDGEQFASNFGYEIATADLNGDGVSDLAIGAPFYFSRNSGGAVYIYINENYLFGTNYTVKLVGKVESRFGFAIANAGDLNKDGCDDLAIGSPYDGNGVVFIYLGNKFKGIDKEPKQVIAAEMLPMTLKTFGYSLSGGLDLDSNGYPDLLVGAYEQDSVVLLRGRPIIDIKTFVNNNETLKNIDPSKNGCFKDPEANLTCFSFETCCRIESLVESAKSTSLESLTLNYLIEAETFSASKKFSRVFFGATAENEKSNLIRKNIELSRGTRHCQEHTVYIKESTRDIQSPILFHVVYTLVQKTPEWKPNGKVPSLEGYPILNATQATQTFQAGLLRNCGTDDICTSDITIDATLELPRNEGDTAYILTLGKEEEVRLAVRVDNLAEAAYEAHLFISHHQGLNYIAANLTEKHVICNLYNKTMIICSLGNPFNKQSSTASPIILRFDPKALEDHELSVDFVVWANSTSQEERPKPPTKVLASVVKNAELTIKGSARPEQVFYGGVEKGESAMKYLDDIGSRILHTYQVYNQGPWRMNLVEVLIDWPHQVANNKPQGKWLLYPEGLPTIESNGGGECTISPKYINPLNLQHRPGFEETPLENLIRIDSSLSTPQPLWNPTYESNKTDEVMSRRKRDIEMVVKPEPYTDTDGTRQKAVNMNCQQATAKCVRITCLIYKLHRNQEATIRIRARLWNTSLVEDYPRVGRVIISSKAVLRVPHHFNIHQNNINDDVAIVETVAYPDLASVEVTGISMYYIILAIFLGIIVLILLILGLWKLGFFKRRRPDPTLSGNIEKHEETAFLPK